MFKRNAFSFAKAAGCNQKWHRHTHTQIQNINGTCEKETEEKHLSDTSISSICWTVCSQHVMSAKADITTSYPKQLYPEILLCPFICTGSIFLASFLHGHVDTFHLHIAYLPALHIFNTQQARWIRTFIRFLGRSASGQVQIQHRHQQQLHQPNLGRRVTGWRLGEKSRNFRWELETSWLVESQAKNMLDDITIIFPQATTGTNPSLDECCSQGSCLWSL